MKRASRYKTCQVHIAYIREKRKKRSIKNFVKKAFLMFTLAFGAQIDDDSQKNFDFKKLFFFLLDTLQKLLRKD